MKRLLVTIIGIASLLMVVSCNSNKISFQGIVLGEKFPDRLVKDSSYSVYSSIGYPTYFDSRSTILLPDSIEKKIEVSVVASEENNRVFEIWIWLYNWHIEESQLVDETQQLYQMLLAKYGQDVESFTGDPDLSFKSQYYSARNYLYYENPTIFKDINDVSIDIPLFTWSPKPNTFIKIVARFWSRSHQDDIYGSYPTPSFGLLYMDKSLKDEALRYSAKKQIEHKKASDSKKINDFRETNTKVLNQDF